MLRPKAPHNNPLTTEKHPTPPLILAGAVLLVFVAFAASIILSERVFERLPHLEDELAYLWQARVFARGDLVIPTPEPRRPFWVPFVIDHNGSRFSKYAPGWSAVLALGVRGGAAWVVNAFAASLIVALTYRIGRDLFNADTGLIAALLLTASPIFLLLNASLMSHTIALLWATLFIYAYWRLEQRHTPLKWGGLAGFALGMLVITRALTAAAIAVPFILYSLGRLAFSLSRGKTWQTLRPLLLLAIMTTLIASTIPLYRYVATGDPTLNPYLLVWDYDRVGFGENVGRSGHTLEKGLRHARYDLSLTAVDLFGWQFTPLTPAQMTHLLTSSSTYPGRGYSWLLLPFGVMIGLFGRQRRWAILLASLPVMLIGVHLAYWIGSQRYSTRYYFEAITAASLLSALPLAWLARRYGRVWVYGGLIIITAYALWTYTFPRLHLLHGFNNVSRGLIEAVESQRQTNAPALVLLNSEQNTTWRAAGSILAVTSPYLDSDLVLARNMDDGRYESDILARFPDYEVILLEGAGSNAWLPDE